MKKLMTMMMIVATLVVTKDSFSAEGKVGSPPGDRVTVIGGTTGAGVVMQKYTPDGVSYYKDAFPANHQFEPFVFVSDTTRLSLTAGWKQLGNAWEAGRFKHRMFKCYVANSSSGAVATDSISIRFMTSDDLTVWRELQVLKPHGDHFTLETYTVQFPQVAVNSGRIFATFNLPEDLWTDKYVIPMARRDSTAGSPAGFPSIGIYATGRE